MIQLLPSLLDRLLLGTFLLLLLFYLNFIYLFSFVLPLIQDQVLSLRISCFYFFLFWLVSHSPKKLPTKSPKQKRRAIFFKWVCVSYSNINCGNYCWLKIGHKHWFLGSFMRNPNRFFVVFCLICVELRNCFSFPINALGYHINFIFFFFFSFFWLMNIDTGKNYQLMRKNKSNVM